MTPDGAVTSIASFQPLETRMLPVGDGHEVYLETIGTRAGMPAVYLHGGPGSGCQPAHRQLFDPARFYAVLFDQRGAGRSRPAGERRANTTTHLIADMEAIRESLGIDKWLVVGGSWGATLALAYSQAHPDRVSGIVLRATFLGTRAELDQAFGVSLPRFYPALHADFLSLLPPDERDDPVPAYWRRILDPDPAVHGPFARAWGNTEAILSEIRPAATRLDLDAIRHNATRLPPTALMEAHYFANDSFLAPSQLMANTHRLAGIPGIIIQGQYDLLCPPQTAHTLVALWPTARIVTVAVAGHSLTDPGITQAVKSAIAAFA